MQLGQAGSHSTCYRSPRRLKRRVLALCVCVLAVAGCGGGGGGGGGGESSASDNNGSSITGNQSLAVSTTNGFRSDAGLSSLVGDDVLQDAAIRHAGYQAVRANGLTHYQSTNGSATGSDDVSNPMFWARDFDDRIGRSASGEDLATWRARSSSSQWSVFLARGWNRLYETISSLGSPDTGVAHLWNTVYHRLPFMRHQTTHMGYGNQTIAAANFDSVPSGSGFSTVEFGGNSNRVRTLSYWPTASTPSRRIETVFDTDSEWPDPLDGSSGPNSAPSDRLVGTPIHLIYPASGRFASLVVTVARVGGSGNEPIVILVGNTAPTGAYRDTYLNDGEVFVLPSNPLLSNTEYRVTFDFDFYNTTTALTESPSPITWTFTTGS